MSRRPPTNPIDNSIEEQNLSTRRILLDGEVKSTMCSKLSFEEAMNLRNALSLPSLKCDLFLVDDRGQQIPVKGVNKAAVRLYKLLQIGTVHEAYIYSLEHRDKKVQRLLEESGVDLTDYSIEEPTRKLSRYQRFKKYWKELGAEVRRWPEMWDRGDTKY